MDHDDSPPRTDLDVASERVQRASLQLREAHSLAQSWCEMAKSARTPEENDSCREQFNVAKARWREALDELESAQHMMDRTLGDGQSTR
jgi:hypothetical protein